MQSHTSSDDFMRIQDLGKQYANGTWGLRRASARFAAGRMTAVLGPNGAGKSTLIHMLAGAIQPTEGTITLTDPSRRIGWSSQRTTIDWYLNALQNVEIGGRLYGLNRRESRSRARALLDRFQLSDLAGNDVSMLSGGQQQRIQVARTLISDPDIMLLDEPTASLDVESSEAVLGFIQERTRSGALALVSSHDLGLLERFCEDVLFVLDGRIVAHQSMPSFLQRFTPEEVIDLTLERDVSDSVIVALARHAPTPQEDDNRQITLSLGNDWSLAEVINSLNGIATVMEATRKPASLRNVYLHMTTNKESAQ